jgi:hypothetical protein
MRGKCRAGLLVIQGTLGDVRAANSGVGKMYIGGSIGSVNADVTGVGEVFIDPKSGAASSRHLNCSA